MQTSKEPKDFCEHCRVQVDGVPGTHARCVKIMTNQTNHSYLEARIGLSYYKQGYDLSNHIVPNDLAAAFENHAKQMEGVVRQLKGVVKAIKDLKEDYPNIDADVELQADTHHIGLGGPKEIIQKLVKSEFIDLEYYDEAEEEYLFQEAGE
jgi:hypothetical protein